ncbi:hypothetical protein DWU98_07670 [Dyella monticola]|uniref:Uncharacterized protein n=1 Tax=Dyella monticola TaxID=1927958 RepID=A0A370X435_9GAMM|nr:hypothetical protein DWU98_07670 [Dyella monticola]
MRCLGPWQGHPPKIGKVAGRKGMHSPLQRAGSMQTTIGLARRSETYRYRWEIKREALRMC